MEPEDHLDMLAKRRSAATGATYAAAYTEVLKTDHGRVLAESLRWKELPAEVQN